MTEPIYPIQTARLTLRPFEDTDLDDVYAYHSLPEVVRYLPWELHDREATQAALQRKKSSTRWEAEGDALKLAVVLSETGTVIGEVILFWRSVPHSQGEVGYVFHPDFGGKGYATEATRAMISFGFDTLALRRIHARCDARNTASWKLMERLGMRREAYFRQNEMFKGEWSDELVYAILRDEWHKQTVDKAECPA